MEATKFQTPSKSCTECGVVKTLADFGKAKTCVDGHRSYCKVCHKGRKAVWYAANKDHCYEKSRKWVAENPEKNRISKLKYDVKWRESGKALEYRRAYRKRFPDKCRAHVNSRRSKVKTATPVWANKKQIEAFYLSAQKLNLSVDHIVPLSHPEVCGLHVPHNLQLLTLEENTMKSNKFNGVLSRTKCRETNYTKKGGKK